MWCVVCGVWCVVCGDGVWVAGLGWWTVGGWVAVGGWRFTRLSCISFSSSTRDLPAPLTWMPHPVEDVTSLFRNEALHSPSISTPTPSVSLSVFPLMRPVLLVLNATAKGSLLRNVFARRSGAASASMTTPPPALSRIEFPDILPLPPCFTCTPASPFSCIVLSLISGSDPLSTIIAQPLCSESTFSFRNPRAYSQRQTPFSPPVILLRRRVTCGSGGEQWERWERWEQWER